VIELLDRCAEQHAKKGDKKVEAGKAKAVEEEERVKRLKPTTEKPNVSDTKKAP
jgi:hypothetical protein